MPRDEARRVDAPVTLEEAAVGPVEISLVLRPGMAVSAPTSETHSIRVVEDQIEGYKVELTARTIPNKDFVLRYWVSSDSIRTVCVNSRDGDFETALITVLPPRFEPSVTPPAREFVFVLDRSGSMSGGPIEQAKNALRACVRALNGTDTFTIQAFNSQIEWFSVQTLPVTQANVDAVDGWLDRIDGRWGTDIVPAVEAAMSLPADTERQRYIVFLTDGAVSAEKEALERINRQPRQARVFSFGIGPSVNRYLLVKMAQMGRGAAEFLTLQEDIEAAITRFQDRISFPVLLNVTLQWHEVETWDAYPVVLPDLYVGEPLEIVSRLQHAESAALKVSGTLEGKAVEMSVDVPPATETIPALQRLWARARIESLLDRDNRAPERRDEIISLGLKHRLLTPFTSFVAVDTDETSTKGRQHVRVAVPLPEGLDYEGFFGQRPMLMYAAGLSQPSAPPPARYGGSDVAPRMRAGAQSLPGDLPEFLQHTSGPLHSRRAVESSERRPETIENRLKWLARTQNVDGSWDGVEMTSAALLAFARAGHSTREGHYRRQVDKAARWLQGKLAELRGLDLFLAVRALEELQESSGDSYVPNVVRANMPEPKSEVERAAQGLRTPELPASIQSLDDLRLVALVQGNVETTELRERSSDEPLMKAWLAVGTPRS